MPNCIGLRFLGVSGGRQAGGLCGRDSCSDVFFGRVYCGGHQVVHVLARDVLVGAEIPRRLHEPLRIVDPCVNRVSSDRSVVAP